MREKLQRFCVVGLGFREVLLALAEVAPAVVAVAEVAAEIWLVRMVLDQRFLESQGFAERSLGLRPAVGCLVEDAEIVADGGQILADIALTELFLEEPREVVSGSDIVLFSRGVSPKHLFDLAGTQMCEAGFAAQGRVLAVALEKAVVELEGLLQDVAADQLHMWLVGQAAVANLRQLVDGFTRPVKVVLRTVALLLGKPSLDLGGRFLPACFLFFLSGMGAFIFGDLLQLPGFGGTALLQAGKEDATQAQAEQGGHADANERGGGGIAPRPLPGAFPGGRGPGGIGSPARKRRRSSASSAAVA